MSILNDKEIRKRCMKATHTFQNPNQGRPEYLSKIDNTYYAMEDGSCYPNDRYDFDNHSSVRKLDLQKIDRDSEPWLFREPMITPFEPQQVRTVEGKKIISYGTSSMGYDVRMGNKFKIFTNMFNALIDPLDMPNNAYVDHEGDYVIIPPNSYVLGHTIEQFHMPDDVMAVCLGKSTYARAGCACNVTPVEPGFVGVVVIEVSNQTNLPMKLYANQGIAQLIFHRGLPCETSYADRGGKYQNQTGIQTAIV